MVVNILPLCVISEARLSFHDESKLNKQLSSKGHKIILGVRLSSFTPNNF